MTILEFCEIIDGKIVAAKEYANQKITGGYTGDLLSLAISKAKAGDAFITVMNNINTLAVATLIDVSCIILSEATKAPMDMIEKANEVKIPIIESSKPSFELCVILANRL